jgi:hypothetical protein
MKLNNQEIESLVNSILREEQKSFEKNKKTDEDIKKEIESSAEYHLILDYIENCPNHIKNFFSEKISRTYRQATSEVVFNYVRTKRYKHKEFKSKYTKNELKDLIVLNMIEANDLKTLFNKLKIKNPLI